MKHIQIVIIGLGYVGLPLAVEFGKHYRTYGYDTSNRRIDQLRAGMDATNEYTIQELEDAQFLSLHDDLKEIPKCDFIIVCVPTPVDDSKNPDLRSLSAASQTAGQLLKSGSIVVFESTVYPGATVEFCVPLIQSKTELCWKRDFFVGFSPERINPGDRSHTLTNIAKVVSGDCEHSLSRIYDLYNSIVNAPIIKAQSIEYAEAAKIIENTQRDVNIALINELAIFFKRIDLDTDEVLKLARTKWNFLDFRPGLVGGHCIGVDPYYLTHKARCVNHHPELILSSRRINDGMVSFIALQIYRALLRQSKRSSEFRIGVFGLAFKENVSDLRNSKSADLIKELQSFGGSVVCSDPKVSKGEAKDLYGIDIVDLHDINNVDAIVLAVPHQEFLDLSVESYTSRFRNSGYLFDIKSMLNKKEFSDRGVIVWRL